MSSDSTTDYNIYTGVWTDWSRGKIFGATLTTTHTSGSLLIAFLSLFVTIIGTSFWRIGCFIFHHIYSTETSRNAIYHQRQAVLRNTSNAVSGLTSLLQILYAWRQTRPFKAMLPLIAFTVLTLSAFAIASTFSSRISTITGNAVLVSSNDCGLTRMREIENDTEWSTLFLPYMSGLYASSATYAEQCYVNPPGTEACNKFVQRSLPTKITRNATCPFANNICKTQDSNILLDTGYLDSHHHFGLNTPTSQRYQYRRIMHCAPLITEGYTQEVQSLRPDLHTPYMRFYYGHKLYLNVTTTAIYNFTYQHPVLQKDQLKLEDFSGPTPDFDLRILGASYANDSLNVDMSTFAPIKELERLDADIRLIFLSANSVIFNQQIDDLWYSAHDVAGKTGHSGNEGLTYAYWSDEVSSPLACTLQEQYCNPNLQKNIRCTPLSGHFEALNTAVGLWQGDEEFEAFDWIKSTIHGEIDNLSLQLAMLGSSGLDSFSRKFKGEIGQLPSDQWQLDVEKWNNMSLALMQQNFVTVAAGPSDSQISDRWLARASTRAEKQFCKNQKILSTAYTNFSVFGLAIILTVGGLIIITSYTLEPFITWIQRRRNLDVYARLEWVMNETLQLQRLAHEELGLGTWSQCDKDVPITESRQRLGVLDLNDLRHPRLKPPPTSFEEVLDEDAKGRGRPVLKETQVVSVVAVESDSSMPDCSNGDVFCLQKSDIGTGALGRDSRQGT